MTPPSRPDGPAPRTPPPQPTGEEQLPIAWAEGGSGAPSGGDSPEDPGPSSAPRAADPAAATFRDGGAFASRFARRHFFSGIRLLVPGRRAVVAVAGVAGVVAIAVGAAAVIPKIAVDDHVGAQPAAVSSSVPSPHGSDGAAPSGQPGKGGTAAPAGPRKGGTVDGSGNGSGTGSGGPALIVGGVPMNVGPPVDQGGQTDGGGPAAGAAATRPPSTTSTTTPRSPATGNPTKAPDKAPSISFTGGLIMSYSSNLCLGTRGGSRSAGTTMVLAGCSTSDPSQGWIFAADGTVRDFGGTMCLDLPSAGNGTLLRIAACSSGRGSQQDFLLKSSHDLVNVHADLCADIKDKGTSAGTAIQVWTCYGTSNQKWHVP